MTITILRRARHAFGFTAATLLAMCAAVQAETSQDCGVQNRDWIAACSIIIDSPTETLAARAKALRIRGIAEFKQEEFDAAIADFSAVIAIEPKNMAAYVNRAGAYGKKRAFDRALADFNTAISLDPKQEWAFLERGNAYKTMGDFVHARQDYDEAIRLKPDVATFYRRRGSLRNDQGDRGGAITDFETAIRLKSDDFLAYSERGDVRAAQHDYDKAVADYDAALKLNPKAMFVYSVRAVAFRSKGEFERALADYDMALKSSPDDASLLNGRAGVRFITGDFAGSASDFGGVIKGAPAFQYAVLMRFLARARMGEMDSPELRRNAQALDHAIWPWPVLAVFLGEMTQDEMRSTAVGGDAASIAKHSCEVAFYLGEYALIRRRQDEAMKLFQQATETCPSEIIERNAAMAELNRLHR